MIRYRSYLTREGRLLNSCDTNCPRLIEFSLPEGDTVKLNKAQKLLIRLTRNVKSGLELTRGRGEQQESESNPMTGKTLQLQACVKV